MKVLKTNKRFYIVALLTVIIVIVGVFYILNNLFSLKELDDNRCVFLFEEYTKSEFPKSGIILKKSFLSGVNDGWEAVVVKVNDSLEFYSLKEEIAHKKFISPQLKKAGIGYFNSEIYEEFDGADTIMHNFEGRFKLEFIDDGQIIIFEKIW